VNCLTMKVSLSINSFLFALSEPRHRSAIGACLWTNYVKHDSLSTCDVYHTRSLYYAGQRWEPTCTRISSSACLECSHRHGDPETAPVATTRVMMGLRTCTDRAVIIFGRGVTLTSGISLYIDLTQE
jgi:hypothetical protein